MLKIVLIGMQVVERVYVLSVRQMVFLTSTLCFFCKDACVKVIFFIINDKGGFPKCRLQRVNELRGNENISLNISSSFII